MNLLVTGGAGFIGRHFVRYAAPLADRVFVVDALTYAGDEAAMKCLPSNVTARVVNIRDVNHLRSTLTKCKPTHIVHLAAETHVDRSITDAEAFILTNIIGTANLLEICRQAPMVEKMVYVSTDEVYGGEQNNVNELAPLNPSSPYSASKAAAEMLCLAEFHTYKLPVVITRGTNTYGPGQHQEKFLPTIVRKLFHGRPVPIYGDGLQVRDWMHVTDHCTGIWAALVSGTPGEVYNLGARNPMTNLGLVEKVAACLGKVAGVEHVEDRKGHDRCYSVSPAKAEQILCWNRQMVPFELHLKDVVHSYM